MTGTSSNGRALAPVLATLTALALVAVLAVGCVSADTSSSDGDEPAPATTLSEPPDMVGTWIGDYSYPFANPDGSPQAVEAHERLTIDHQEGGLVWGHDEFVDGGQVIRIPVRGTVDVHGVLILAEENGWFRGELQPDGSMLVRFARTDDQFTAFSTVLTRS